VARLRKLLDHPGIRARTGAAHGLALLQDRDSFGKILGICRDPENHSGEPRRILALLRTPEARKALASELSYPDARMLDALAGGGKELLALLQPRLSHQDVWTRWSALQAIGRMEGDEALAEIRRRMADEADEVREAAAQILCRRGLREGVPLALEHSGKPYRPLPFELNAVRAPAGWAKLKSARLTGPFHGSARDLVVHLAAQAKLPVEDLPKDSAESPAWTNVHVRIHEAETPIDGIEAVARLSQTRWTLILEADRIRVVGRTDARRFWKEWGEKEGK
jgi:hypothetical protein